MIRRFWTWLFGEPHRHEWETVDIREMRRTSDKAVIAYVYVLRCKHCGNIKQETVGIWK